MSLKSFKEYIAEGTGTSAATNLVPNVQQDDETKSLEPQAKGEKDFKDMHTMQHTKHPVAGDHQFDGSREAVSA